MDFLALDTEVNFLPSETTKTVSIPLVNDGVQEFTEWFTVELDSSSAQDGVALGVPAVANVTIVDDDSECRLNVRYTYYDRILFEFPRVDYIMSDDISKEWKYCNN